MTWEELATGINRTPGFQIAIIGFVPEIPQLAIQHYRRWAIQRVGFHENLLSIHLSWEAIFLPLENRWTWLNPPVANKAVQVIDWDTTKSEARDTEGGLVRIEHIIWMGMLTRTHINPASINPNRSVEIITSTEPVKQVIEGGMWILPPFHKGILDPATIR